MPKSVKRRIAETQVKLRKRQREKHEAEMRRAGLARNKELKKAKEATERAKSLEASRLASEKKARAIAKLSAEKKAKQFKRIKKARKFIKTTMKSFRSLQKTTRKRR